MKTLKTFSVLILFASWLQAQTAPSTLQSVVPRGGQRGMTVKVLVDGINLGKVNAVLFNDPGLSASVVEIRELPNNRPEPEEGEVIFDAVIEDNATRNRVTLNIRIGSKVRPGTYGFRISTPLGITNMLPFGVGGLPEVNETQVNDSIKTAQRIELPSTVRGEISHSGDVDYFSFEARAGQELVFDITAAPLGSQLNSLIALVGQDGKILAENDDFKGIDSVLVYKIEEDGLYSIQVSDAQKGSGGGFHYQLQAGDFPYVTGVFPLGVQAGVKSTVKVKGANLSGSESVAVNAEQGGWGETIRVSVPPAWNEVLLAAGTYPEDFEREPNGDATSAQAVALPVTVNGRILAASGADEDLFRFSAQKGQKLVLEVEADRLGSPLDSVIEILDLAGNPVPRAMVRCVAQTEVTLRDHGSTQANIRVVSWDDFAMNDYIMLGSEILRVTALPRSPDDDLIVESFLGRRLNFFDTTGEGHALGDPVYKVQVYPPGSKFPPNGMPVFHLNHRNDDGGPMYGRDSRLSFEAPADGDYLVRIRDVRGLEGDWYPYRLTIREAAPDFRLTSGSIRIAGQFGRSRGDRQYYSIPAGGKVPVNVVAYRIDGFNEEIEVTLEGLPEGVTAASGIIPPNDDSTMILLSASPDASFEAAEIRVIGRAKAGDRSLVRYLDTDRQLSVVALSSSAPEIEMAIGNRRVEIMPGQEAKVTIAVNRQNGFKARVPVDIRNLPYGVRVLDVGLNGILVTEEEQTRTFTLYAEPWVQPVSRPFYAVGRVETNSFIPVEHASSAVELVVLPQRASQ